MTITLFAQPYDITATGFYFETLEEYEARVKDLRNAHGDRVEEFEIQFIEGDDLDCQLAKAIGLSQANFPDLLECAEMWDDGQKLKVIIATAELGYACDPAADPDQYDIDIYHVESLRELAEQFVDEGLLGDIPDNLRFYIDYDAFARDLAADYCEVTIAGQPLIYRAG